MLTGFQSVDEKKVELGKYATLKNRQSQFVDGLELAVEDWGYVVREDDGKVSKDARPNLVLKTDKGNIFCSMLTRAKVTHDGKVLEPNGTFNVFFKEMVAKHDSDQKVLDAVVKALKDKHLRVRRTQYIATGYSGLPYPAALIEFDIVG